MGLFLKLIFLCPALFLAGLVDGIAGGGGIISLPSYIMTGLPLNVAYGCNKLQSCLGTSASLYRYAKSGRVDIKSALATSATAISGSYISTQIMLSLSDSVKNIIIISFMCFVIILTLLLNNIKSGELYTIVMNTKNILICLVMGAIIGLYDGFFGPGGGTVSLMLFVLLLNLEITTATGSGKIVIVISNFIALISYISSGNILYEIAIPSTISNIIGSYIGASLAVKNGKKLVKPILFIVVVIVLIQGILKII